MDSPSASGRVFSPSLSARPRASSSSLQQVTSFLISNQETKDQCCKANFDGASLDRITREIITNKSDYILINLMRDHILL